MAKAKPKPKPEKGGKSFDAAIKEALRRGLSITTGTDGARTRTMAELPHRFSVWRRSLGGLIGAVRRREVFTFCHQLAVLLECGMQLVKALNTLANRAANLALGKVIMSVGNRVEEGVSFCDAVSEHPRAFPPLVVNMFRAGEQSGNLTQALYRVAEHGERLTSARQKVLAALIYPAVVVVLTVAVVAFAFRFSMAGMSKLMEDLKVQPPASMAALIRVANLFRSNQFWFALVAVIVGLFVLYAIARRFRVFRLLRDRLLIRLPIARYFVKESLVANFARVFSTLYGSGVPLIDTLQATHSTTRNEVLRLAIERVIASVREGGRMGEPLEQAAVFPPLAYDMIAVGEEAGALDRVFEKMAALYEERFATDTALVAKFVQPAIVVFLAVVVGFVVVSFFSMYASILEQIKG